MTNTQEIDDIRRCLIKIEEQLAWGNSEGWSNYDFEKLSEAILEKTGARLSTTTLKRIWGRVKYESAPTTATLNTLAQYAGYTDWRNFVQANGHLPEPTPQPENIHLAVEKPVKKKRPFLVAGLLLALGVLATGYFVSQKKVTPASVDTSKFSFKADKVVAEGVPNSVIFTYDASNAKTDSVYIVQTWDIRRKTLVPKEQTKHSAIYYYPGYFRTRLIVDDKVVKTHDLQVTSNGWLGLIEKDDKPFYFNKQDITKQDRVEIDEALLASNNFTLTPIAPKVRFFNQGDLGDLMNDNFELQTTVKNDYKGGNNTCQYVEVLIQCKNDIIIIPLINTACVGDAYLRISANEFMSKYADLSGFGADLSEWTTLHVICVNKKMQFFVNNKKAFEFTFPNQSTGIVGLQYRFNGMGAVKDTWFMNKEKKVIKL